MEVGELEINKKVVILVADVLTVWRSILLNEYIEKAWLPSISMRLPHIITFLTSLILMSLGCENRSASKRSEMQKLVQEIPTEERASVQTDFLVEALSLTPEQCEKLGQINSKYAREVESILRSDDYRSQKARRFKSVMASKDRELKKVFSKEQYKMYDQIREELKQRLRERR